MTSSQVTGRAVVLALVLAVAAGVLAAEGEALTGTTSLVLVLMGAMAVGGLAPRRLWWLGGLVGVGVAAGLIATAGGAWTSSPMATRGREVFGSQWVGLAAPLLVAVAASGLGASLQRYSSSGE